jgi:hypothetical protein
MTWPTTLLHFLQFDRCEEVESEAWEVTSRPETSEGIRTLAGLVGGLVVTGGVNVLVLAAGAKPPVRPGDPPNASSNTLSTMGSVGLSIGASFLGVLAGRGLVSLWERAHTSVEAQHEVKQVTAVRRHPRPLEGVLDTGTGRRWATHRGTVELSLPELLELKPDALRLDGAPIELAPADQRQLAITQACARAVAAPKSSTLTDAALCAVVADAQICFEGGVAAADSIYSALLAEQMRRRHP